MIFVFYFLMTSLVFMGQDLSVSRHISGDWCVSLAEHCQVMWSLDGNTASTGSLAATNCGHQHRDNEVHVCIDHHKFIVSNKAFTATESGIHRSSAPSIPEASIPSCSNQYRQTPAPRKHDPGLALCGLNHSPVLLL